MNHPPLAISQSSNLSTGTPTFYFLPFATKPSDFYWQVMFPHSTQEIVPTEFSSQNPCWAASGLHEHLHPCTQTTGVWESLYKALKHPSQSNRDGLLTTIPQDWLIDQGHVPGSGAEPWPWVKLLDGFLSLKSTNICAKLSHQSQFRARDFLRNMTLLYTYPAPTGWGIQLCQGPCHV